MSLVSKIIVSAMLAIKDIRIRKGSPFENIDAEMEKARVYNRKHAYREPKDARAHYRTIAVGDYPCLFMRPKNAAEGRKRAILFLHGGGDRDTWKPEVSFARTYARRTGMDVFYPIYPPFSEASVTAASDYVYLLYQRMLQDYPAEHIAVIGGSYGGFLAMQLLTWINRDHNRFPMPGLLIMNSPFGFPQTREEWRLAEEYGKKDAFVPAEAVQFMLDGVLRADPRTPDYALYPMKMDFHNAPDTYVYYAEEVCAAVSGAIRMAYQKAGAGDKFHLHIEPGMMHCYACAPVFKESRRDFNRQIELLNAL